MADSVGSTGWFTQTSLHRVQWDGPAPTPTAPLPPVEPVVASAPSLPLPPPATRFVFSSTGDRHRIRFTAPGGGALDGLSASDLKQLRAALDVYLGALPDGPQG